MCVNLTLCKIQATIGRPQNEVRLWANSTLLLFQTHSNVEYTWDPDVQISIKCINSFESVKEVFFGNTYSLDCSTWKGGSLI